MICRFGATFSDFPNIKKYVATMKVGAAINVLSMSQMVACA